MPERGKDISSKEAVSRATWRLAEFLAQHLPENNQLRHYMSNDDLFALYVLRDVMQKTGYTLNSQENISIESSEIPEPLLVAEQTTPGYEDLPNGIDYIGASATLGCEYYSSEPLTSLYEYDINFMIPAGDMKFPKEYVRRIKIRFDTSFPSLDQRSGSLGDVANFRLDYMIFREGVERNKLRAMTFYLYPKEISVKNLASSFYGRYNHEVYKTEPIDIENAIENNRPFKLFVEWPEDNDETIIHREHLIVPIGIVDIPGVQKLNAYYNSWNDDVIYEREA